ncbi:hypothetical protein Godav_001069 [Gossypium davidsonii]|uniref:Uncharacterized protein n=1 Tax=Gossypium davidsonii TaxID=34287 RepID=A0A7J8T272_GOSDV|nr:hypothetical protein [Gossypium davidsonii]
MIHLLLKIIKNSDEEKTSADQELKINNQSDEEKTSTD